MYPFEIQTFAATHRRCRVELKNLQWCFRAKRRPRCFLHVVAVRRGKVGYGGMPPLALHLPTNSIMELAPKLQFQQNEGCLCQLSNNVVLQGPLQGTDLSSFFNHCGTSYEYIRMSITQGSDRKTCVKAEEPAEGQDTGEHLVVQLRTCK